jgi:hypothetical protein
MRHKRFSARRLRTCAAVAGAMIAGFTMTPRGLLAASGGAQVFNTPEAAAAALAKAATDADANAALQILGPDAKTVISSGDPVADKNAAQNFASSYAKMHRLAYDDKGRVILYLGPENWPFPIPLVKEGSGWEFDTADGAKEILYRRIGSNELLTIATLRELVAAQNEYKAQISEGGSHQFAAKLMSDSGTHDGLYWPASAGAPASPIGPLIASATAEGYKAGAPGQPTAFHGYDYRILTSQGKDAPGGAKDYKVDGKLTQGFAIVAWPAEYRVSGVMTFIVNQDGTIFQKDLGPETDKTAPAMSEYDPDKSWEAVAEYADR